ncbi:MAG: 40S ribosomal protein S19 [Candidatus Woesearchaeota archaeon]
MKQEIESQKIIEKLAKKLNGKISPPEWAQFVKTGHGKQRPPTDKDWWYTRAASMLLKIQKLGPIGVNKLSVKYGTRKNRGVRPEKFTAGSRNHIRKIAQQLESQKLIQKAEIGVHKGKILTNEGNRLIIEASKEAIKGDKK